MMAADVWEMLDALSVRRDADGHREYRTRYAVRAPSADAAKRTPGLPRRGDRCAFAPDDPDAVCRGEPRVVDEGGRLFVLEYTFGTRG
jgi:hypothetical protein